MAKPKIRFKGYQEDWEQRKFGELGSVAMCKRIFKEQTSPVGDIPFYKIGTFGVEPDAFISRELFEEYKEKFQYPKIGDMLISASGTIGRTVEYDGEEAYFQDSNIVWFKHDERVDNSFLKCIYGIVKWSGIEGSTIKRLYNDNFLKTEFYMPSVAEQEKIGEYFTNLDHLITLHQRKCDETKKLKNKTLKSVILSGDWIPLHVPEKMSRYIPEALLISMGGATEASIWSNYYEVKKFNPQWKSIPYGYPLENQKFFILDEFNRPCPDMVAGRLFIAGKGVAQGYYNSPEITEKSFQHIVSVYDGILYETGDWGRYHKNGCIEFLGRKDNQLKINGYRVEIGEIQEVMKKSGAEDSVIVLIGEKADNKRLIAFVVSSYGENEMKANMKKYLPEYFIPDKIMVMEKFPVTPNGKIDRKALISEYEKTLASAETAAENNFIDDIIDPSQTRNVLVSALDILSGKRVQKLPKKHNNIQF